MKGKRGVMFFTLDTIIASVVLTMTAIILFSIYINQPITEDMRFTVQEYGFYISNTEMGGIGSNIYSPSGELADIDGLKVDEKVSLLIDKDKEEIASDMVESITQSLIIDGAGIEYKLDNKSIYKRNVEGEPRINLSTSTTTYFVYNDTLYGKNTTEVSIWY